MYGATISWQLGHPMAGLFGYSRFLMSIQGSVWLYWWGRHISSEEVVDQLFHLFVFRRIPEYLRSDNGPEFTAKVIREWLNRLGVTTLLIELGSPWENGYVESFNGKLGDELINREVFTTLLEAKILIKNWRRDYNEVRPHSSLGYRPPAPEAIQLALTPAPLTQKVVSLLGADQYSVFSQR